MTGVQTCALPILSLEENREPEQNEANENPNPEALKYFMNGQMLMNQGDFPMAIIEFQEALNLDPNVGTIYTSIAECYWNIGKPELSMKKSSFLPLKKNCSLYQKNSRANILQKQYYHFLLPLEQLFLNYHLLA